MKLEPYFYPYFHQFDWKNKPSDQILWVVPRIDLIAELKKQWASYCGGKVQRAALVQSVDRLSQPRAVLPWANCMAQLVRALRNQSALSRGLSGAQIWLLASEILDYARRLVLQQEPRKHLAKYSALCRFSEREVAFIIQVAEVFADELKNLWILPDKNWVAVEQVIWFDDGETLPQYWLQAFLPNIPVQRVELPLISGSEPWLQLCHSESKASIALTLAPNEQTQAQQAAAVILNWLREDDQTEVVVAVVDRLAARFLVPVLNQLNIQVDDRTGWQLSTSALAGWFNQFLKQLSEEGEIVTLTHPFTGSCLSEFTRWKPLSTQQSMSVWAEQILHLLQTFGLIELISNDRAGHEVLKTFRILQAVTLSDEVSAQDFYHAWQYYVETMRFRPVDVTSVVRLTPLLSTRMQGYSRVLVLGCAQSHFQESPPGLLPPGVAFDLGLTGASLSRKQKISALWELVRCSQALVFCHAQSAQGRPENLLPELEYLGVLSRVNSSFLAQTDKKSGDNWLLNWENFEVKVNPSLQPNLQLNAAQIGLKLPNQLSVTALDDWVACPMRFGLSRLLGFNQMNSLDEKSFYQLRGMLVHAVLDQACQSIELNSSNRTDFKVWVQALNQAVLKVYAEFKMKDQAQLYPFVEFFMRLVPRLAGQLLARWQQGWQLVATEKRVSALLPLKSGQMLTLSGRIDRLEQRNGQLAIIDIKFKQATMVKKQAKLPLENPQLPAYQAMLCAPNAELMYLAIDSDSVEWVPILPPKVEEELMTSTSWGEHLWLTLAEELDAFFDQTIWQLRPGKACQTCSVLGICRPSYNKVDLD